MRSRLRLGLSRVGSPPQPLALPRMAPLLRHGRRRLSRIRRWHEGSGRGGSLVQLCRRRQLLRGWVGRYQFLLLCLL